MNLLALGSKLRHFVQQPLGERAPPWPHPVLRSRTTEMRAQLAL